MPAPHVDDQSFIRIWTGSKSASEALEKIGYPPSSMRSMMRHRRTVERRYGISLPAFIDENKGSWPEWQSVEESRSGEFTILVGSDKHCKPGTRPQALKAFIALASEVRPTYLIINGDWFDFPSIGRFHRIGWESRPTVKDELQAGLEDMQSIKDASPKSKRFFIMGNHDMRFNGFLANRMPEMEGVEGHSLEEVIARRKLGFELAGLDIVFNDSLIVKHRWHGGVHSAYNDVLRSGKNIATGHDHKLQITPFSDYNGTRYGIKTGTLSDIWDESFMYAENNPRNWQPGCVLITMDGPLVMPEACPLIYDRHHRRRGQIHCQGKWYG